MPKLKYFTDYCVLGDKRIDVAEFTNVLKSVTLPNVSLHFGISDFITKSIMNHYDLASCRHYDTGLPTVFFEGDEVIWNGHRASKDSIIEFYITQNHSKEETMVHFNLSSAAISKAIQRFNIQKPRSLYVSRAKATNLRRHGDENYNNMEQNIKTVQDRYGVNNVFQLDWVKDKSEETLLKKYGYKHAAQSPKIQQKTHETHVNRYGMHYSQTQEYKDKCEATSLANCGATHHMKTAEGKSKFDYVEIAHKAFETKKLNGTTNTSKPEQDFYEFLLTQFDSADIYREYKCELYPFHCDFYIKSLDMFIELNLFFTHGDEPFNSTNTEHLDILKTLQYEAERSDFYKNTIHVWTKLDPLKLSYMIKNKLNYRICYNDNDIENLKEELLK